MTAQRPFKMLDVSEISRLMELAIEVGLRAYEFSPQLVKAFGVLAAEFGFELWSREQARLEVRRECGRQAGHGPILRRMQRH